MLVSRTAKRILSLLIIKTPACELFTIAAARVALFICCKMNTRETIKDFKRNHV